MQNAKAADVFDLAQLDSQIREAARKYRLTEDERDELRQEAAVLILERREEFDAAIWKAVLRAAGRIRRSRPSPKRRRTFCIDWLDENDPALIVRETDPATNVELQEVMQMMPADLRAICERLMYETPCSAARSLKMSPRTLRRKMQEIRKRLAAFGYAPKEEKNDG